MEKRYHIDLDDSHGASMPYQEIRKGREMAGYLENPRFLTAKREYTSWIGQLDGEKVLVTSTGIGAPLHL